MINPFTPTAAAQSMVGSAATQPGVDERSSVVQTRLKWFESPLMFIGVIVAALVLTAYVESKVG